jgi:hypothetical protein
MALRLITGLRPRPAQLVQPAPGAIPASRSITSDVAVCAPMGVRLGTRRWLRVHAISVMVLPFSSRLQFAFGACRCRGGASGAAPASAGATIRAVSSSERRMAACGGSMECTWNTRSVVRASAVSAAARRSPPRACPGARHRLRSAAPGAPGGPHAGRAGRCMGMAHRQAAQTGLGPAQRVFTAVGHQQGARTQDARAPALRAGPPDRHR